MKIEEMKKIASRRSREICNLKKEDIDFMDMVNKNWEKIIQVLEYSKLLNDFMKEPRDLSLTRIMEELNNNLVKLEDGD